MNKEIVSEGMSCSHCSLRGEKVLNSIPGVEDRVNWEKKTVFVLSENHVSDEILSSSIENLSFKVAKIN